MDDMIAAFSVLVLRKETGAACLGQSMSKEQKENILMQRFG